MQDTPQINTFHQITGIILQTTSKTVSPNFYEIQDVEKLRGPLADLIRFPNTCNAMMIRKANAQIPA